MPNLTALSIDPSSSRGKILSKVNPDDFAWALPFMRTGYAGRGLVYLVVAGLSLWSIYRGGQAQGTQSALQSISGGWGAFIVAAVAAGMFAYAIWRVIDSIWDLEAHGTSAKGIIARIGMLVTGLIHAGIGGLAIIALGFGKSGSSGTDLLSKALDTQIGMWAIGIGGLITIGAGIYYLHKAYSQDYRDNLTANHFTLNWNTVLRIGVAAQGIIVALIGGLFVYAAMHSDASDAGGMGSVFDWLQSQPFGQFIIIAICLGLLAFALFCFVNAAYRVVPKAATNDTQTVTARLKNAVS